MKNFHFSHHETNISLIFYMWQVKTSLERKNLFRLSRGVVGVAVGFWTKFEAQLAQPC
jgi:hypothetical protein